MTIGNVLICFCLFISIIDTCSPDVKNQNDQHRRKALEDKFVSNLAELKNHEEILSKAVEMMKKANKKKDENQNEIDYKKRIAEIEKELQTTKDDHLKMLEKHEDFLRKFDRPRTWKETISKYTGDAFGRLLFNGMWYAVVIFLPLLLRPVQRRWLPAIRGRNRPIIEEVTESDDNDVRMSNEEMRQILENTTKKNKRKAKKVQ